MTQLITRDGFVADSFDGRMIAFDTLWTGQDLPIETPLAVILPVDATPEDLIPWFRKLAMIVLPFDKSADGRGFSLAAQLRQLGYTGTLRAQGHILVDQFRAALATGIDEIEISDDQAARNPEHQWRAVPLTEGYRARLFAAE